MTLPQPPPQSNLAHSFSPDTPAESISAAKRAVPPEVRQASPNRLQFRARLTWAAPDARGRQREEIVVFTDARKLLDLLRQINESPARPLLGISLEAIAKPHWQIVPLEFVRWRAAQRDRRDELKRVMAKRAGGAR